ncbi:MAG: dipeptidase [Phenylobacterium sp.]
MRSCVALVVGAAVLAAPLAHAAPNPAKAIHDKLIVLDTHLDAPANFHQPGWDIMDRHVFEDDGSQVDYPRMVEGGLDGGFFAIYTPQGARTPAGDAIARDAAFVRALEIREMVARHGDKFALALTADDAARINAAKKKIVFMSMENSQPVEADLSLMKTFYALGVRMMGPAHFRNNDLADSATDKPEWYGLSPKGRAFVAEANRLGIVLDASHSSDDVLDEMLAYSKTPIVLSHSGAKALYNHPRNIDDAHLKALAAKGGVIQVNALGAYIMDIPRNPDRDAAMAALQKEMGPARELSPAARKAFMAKRREIEAKYPVKQATLAVYMEQLLHCLKVAGVDHVGIGLDMDGGGGVEGLKDASDYWKISAELLKAGYTPADLEKIMGGNVLRVMRAVEAAKAP